MTCTFDAWDGILQAFHRNPAMNPELYVPRSELDAVLRCHIEDSGQQYNTSTLIVEQPHSLAKEVKVRRKELFDFIQLHGECCADEVAVRAQAAKDRMATSAREASARYQASLATPEMQAVAAARADKADNRSRAPAVADDISARLKTLDRVSMEALARAEGFGEKWDAMWSKLPNPGLIRMNLGNALRNKAKKAAK